MAFVYKDTHCGRWYGAYRGADGTWKRRSTGAPSKTLARQVVRRWELEEAQKKALGVRTCADITFRSLAARYLRHSRAANASATARRDRVVIRNVLPSFGNKLLRDIRRRDVQDYLDRRASKVLREGTKSEKRISPFTVEREKIALSALFTYAVDNEFIFSDAHPVKRVKVPKGEKNRQRELLPSEEARVLAVCRDNGHLSYLAPIIHTALNTGLRKGELLRLRWGAVDLTRRTLPDDSRSFGTITVESTNDNPTKDRTTRHVPVNATLHGVLEELHLQALREASATPGAIRERFVFVNPRTGTRWDDIGNAWDSALRRAGIKGLRFHDLRHTFATRARRVGMPLEILQRVLGHAEVTTTMRYAHVADQEVNQAMNLLCGAGVAQRQGSGGRRFRVGTT